MPSTVFWSWQSDKPGKVSRHLLKRVLTRAVAAAGAELGLEESERPALDHDTKGEPGLVSIPESILGKIENASVFVADLTPVARSEAGRYVANPNVLIELGYAKKALGPRQIVLIWNDAWGGCTPEDLPFDLRHRRMPFTYSLAESASSHEIQRVESSLVAPLSEAIAVCLRHSASQVELPAISAAVESRPDDPSVWFEPGAVITVNAGTSYGSDHVTVPESPRSFMRVIPTKWPSGVRPQGIRDGQHVELHPLGDAMGLTWGPTKGGVIAYRTTERQEDQVESTSATQWFAKSGELWGFDGGAVFEGDRGQPTLATDYVVECWGRFLRRAANFYEHYKVAGPFEIRAGITQLEGIHWPHGGLWRDTTLGLEAAAYASVKVPDLSLDSRVEALKAAHSAMRDAFGMEPDEDELKAILERRRRR